MSKTRARDLAKEAAWRQRVDRHAVSGLSVRAWCRRHRVKEAAFHWWRRELARRDAEPASSDPGDVGCVRPARCGGAVRGPSFVPVHVTDAMNGGSASTGEAQIEIMLTDGRRVRVTGTVHREMLTQVLDVLTAVPAIEAEHRIC